MAEGENFNEDTMHLITNDYADFQTIPDDSPPPYSISQPIEERNPQHPPIIHQPHSYSLNPPQIYTYEQLPVITGTQVEEIRTGTPYPTPGLGSGPTHETHYRLALFTKYCCCFPIGVLALCHSRQARNYYANNNYHEGEVEAKTSLRLSILGIVLGVIIVSIIIILGWIVSTHSTDN